MRMEEKCMELTLAQNHSNKAKGGSFKSALFVLLFPTKYYNYITFLKICLHFHKHVI